MNKELVNGISNKDLLWWARKGLKEQQKYYSHALFETKDEDDIKMYNRIIERIDNELDLIDHAIAMQGVRA